MMRVKNISLFVKRLFDFVGTIFLLIVLLIPFLILCTTVFFKLGKPIFFTQQRPGKNGKIFKMYKFRSMTNEQDKNGNLLPNEQRLTKFGKLLRKTSLDELPELINILKGDMSFVGPRPLRVEYLEHYTEEQARRHYVKPGITGWAQINGRNAISWEDKFKFDVWYVDNQSFLLDIKILGITFFKVLKREGINTIDDSLVEPFKGVQLNG